MEPVLQKTQLSPIHATHCGTTGTKNTACACSSSSKIDNSYLLLK